MKSIAVRRIACAIIAFTMLPFFGLFSFREILSFPQIPVKAILVQDETKPVLSDLTWLYYPLGGDYSSHYAVSLVDSIKQDFRSGKTINVPEQVKVNSDRTAIVSSGAGEMVDVVGIWHNAFHGNRASTIYLPPKLQVIDYEAFLYSRINSIEIPYSIEKLGVAAFYACPNLQSVTIKDSNLQSKGDAVSCECANESVDDSSGDSGSSSMGRAIGETGIGPSVKNAIQDSDDPTLWWCSLTTIPSFCFFHCVKLTSFIAPASITDIEWEAFNGCSALNTNFTFYDIKRIRARAFQGCTALRRFWIPHRFFTEEGIIEPRAFNYCSGSLSIIFNNPTDGWFEDNPDWGICNDAGDARYTYTPEETGTNDPQRVAESDWSTDIDVGTGDVTIKQYTGEDPGDDWVSGFLIIPNSLKGGSVRHIYKNFLTDAQKKKLRRIYLPTTLYDIDNEFFSSTYEKLEVISYFGDECRDYNYLRKTGANTYSDAPSNNNSDWVKKRIDLSALTELRFIGKGAFGRMKNKDNIEKVHLPWNLIAVGDAAFANFNGENNDQTTSNFKKVTEFIWDYKEPSKDANGNDIKGTGSRLEAIGDYAFWKFGRSTQHANFNGNNSFKPDKPYKPTTLIFPKTFRYFGILNKANNNDAGNWESKGNGPGPAEAKRYHDEYGFDFTFLNRNNRPGHNFGGSPLIKKVIFKGGSSDTYDLYIPIQSFAFCDSLQSFIIEERNGKTITFHTQNGKWAQTAAGSNGARAMNDFRGDPSLQTIVIPNLYTNVRVQKLAFQGSSRAVMYFSGSEEKGIMANDAAQDEKTGGGQWTKLIGTEFGSADGDSSDLSKATQWNKIGDETCFSSEQVDYKGFLGYAFVPQEVVDGTTTIVPGAFTNKGATYSGDTSSQRSTFDLDQNIKAYWNVHYKEVLKDVDDKDVIVEVGDSNSVNMFTIDQESKCAYLCCPAHDDVRKHAIMTKYLYDLRDKRSDHDVATVKGSVKPLIIGSDNYFNAEEYTVDEIGDSAFSAAFCDGTDGTASGFKDLQKVVVPDSIARIGDYAFLRAYGVKEFGTESGSMPSSLRSIGKNAFTFCNIKQFLDIPYECVFYENTSAAATNYKVCSVFSNNFSLRKISFRNSAGETGKPSSKHYTTATYTSAGDGTPTYTTSLYSASSEAGFGKNNRLLLILYRDESDRERADGTIVTTNNHSVLFDGKRTDGEEPFLYGAYRMGYWIDELEIGPATKDGSNSVLPQPLFSGICRRVVDDSGAQRTVTVTDQYIYLHQPIPGYEDNACDLKVVTGDSLLVAPAFGLCGCESLTSVVLPQVSEKKVPDGLFVGTGENCLFKTENNTADATHLDFVNSGISGIGSSSFKGNQSIEKITFQRDDNKGFVIGENAFEGCTNLEELDFSQVTGTLTIKKGAFKGCTNLTAITWPENGTVDLNDGGDKDFVSDGIFEGCTSLTSVSLPKNKSDKKTIGKYCFKGCTNLSSVTGATGNTYTTVGESAFLNCSSLSDFAFGDFSALTTISANAFNGAGEISLDGNVSFPKTLVEFGNNCFSNSSIVTITFNGESSDLLNLGTGAFYNADNLEAVYFAHSDAGLKSTSDYNVNVFGSCENLVELQLPNTFPISETKDKYFIEGSNDVVIYLAHKAYDATFNSSNKTWFKPTASSSAQVYWLVDEFSDLVSDGEWRYSGAVGLEKNNFWTRDSSGHAVKLGKATSEQTSGSITTVAFTEGQTLTESGGFSPAIESITTVPYRDGALERTLG